MPSQSEHKTACILCSRNCGLTVEIADGQFTRIRGDDDNLADAVSQVRAGAHSQGG